MAATAHPMTVVDLRAAGPSRPFEIPDGDQPVSLTTLRRDDSSGAVATLVRFPAGWTRALPGHYLSDEDFVVLAGSLRIDGADFVTGDWGYFSRGHCRSDSRAGDAGAVALAWFDRAPRWVSAGHHVPVRPAGHRSVASLSTASVDLECPLPQGGERLRHSPDVGLWATDGLESGQRLDRPCQVLAIDSWSWVWLPADTPTPALTGPCVVRVEEAAR